jgi:hypothetical protein
LWFLQAQKNIGSFTNLLAQMARVDLNRHTNVVLHAKYIMQATGGATPFDKIDI